MGHKSIWCIIINWCGVLCKCVPTFHVLVWQIDMWYIGKCCKSIHGHGWWKMADILWIGVCQDWVSTVKTLNIYRVRWKINNHKITLCTWCGLCAPRWIYQSGHGLVRRNSANNMMMWVIRENRWYGRRGKGRYREWWELNQTQYWLRIINQLAKQLHSR